MTQAQQQASKCRYQIGQTYWHEAQCQNPEIAATILKVLKTDGQFAHIKRGSSTIPVTPLMCWGGRQFSDMGDGLKLVVSGKKFKGDVLIILDRETDSYTILIGKVNPRDCTWHLKKVSEMIGVENLVLAIDEMIES